MDIEDDLDVDDPEPIDFLSPDRQLELVKQTTSQSAPRNSITRILFGCLNSSSSSKKMSPIGITSNLPHFRFANRKTDGTEKFNVNIAYDTCAQLNVGYAAYRLALARKFPQVVKTLFMRIISIKL